MNSRKKHKIAIIEPSPVIRRGIKALLEEYPDFTVSASFADLPAFRDEKHHPDYDILLLNPCLVNFYRQFSAREVLSDYSHTVCVALLYGYVDAETLHSFDGALDIYDEGTVMAKKLRKIAEAGSKTSVNSEENVDLSDREKEILVSIAKGMTNKEIADKHYISIHTVISHRKNISRKTGIKTVSGLTLYAMFNNLISQDDLL